MLASPHVDQMDSEQFGWYMKLLMRSWHWDNPGYLPNDMVYLRSLLRVGRRAKEIKEFGERFQIVFERFKQTDDGSLIYNERLLEQLKDLEAKHEKFAQAGLKGGLSRAKARLKHPEPEPDIKPKSKPSRDKRESDPRFQETRKFIERKYELAHLECLWDESEGAQLSRFLKAAPNLNQGQINTMVSNRFASKDPPGKRAREWIPHLSSYATGPLDRFGKEPEVNGTDNTADRERGVIARVQQFVGRGMDSSGVRQIGASVGENSRGIPGGNARKPTLQASSEGLADLLPKDG